MKQALVTAYVFTAAAKTVDLSSIAGFDIKRLYAIINIDANQVIYAVGIPAYGLASISGSTITLAFNTTSMSDADNLAIIYDTVNTDIANAFVTKNTDGTNSQSYTGAGEAKVLVTPLTNASIVKAQLQDNSGSAITLGQKLMASSLPVVLASDQSAISVSQSGSWTTGRTWTLSNGSDSVASVQSGAWTTGRTWTLGSGSDSVSAVQSGTWNIANISGTVSLPTNAAQETGGHLASLDGKFSSLGQKVAASSVPVVIASDQSAIPVSQSGTWNLVNISGTISLPTNAAQETGGHLASLDGKFSSLGQKVAASSTPVVLASDQSAIPVSQSGAWTTGRTWTLASGTDSIAAIQSGTWTVQQGNTPTAIATAWPVKPTDGTNTQSYTASGEAKVLVTPLTNSSVVKAQLQDNAGAAVTLGQKVSASSLPVVIASDQSNLPANITQVGGAAFALGQAAAASSIPVVTQSDSAPATQNITAQDTASTTTGVANGQNFVTGSATAGSTASFNISSFESAEIQVTGVWTGTLSTEISLDGGTTWVSRGIKQNGIPYIASSFTANFTGGTNITSMTQFRVRATAAWTGTATIKAVFSVNQSSITVLNPQTLRDATTQTIMNTIKAASTAPVATDTAIVMAMSPNVAATQAVGGSQFMNVIEPSTSTPGSAIPSRATLVAGSDGTNARAIATDTSGNTEVVGNVASGSADSGAPVKVGAKFNSTLPAISNGQRADLQANQFGELAIVSRNQYKNIHGISAGTLIKTGAGKLHTVVINNQSGGNSVTIYDGTSTGGTLIATITNTGSGPTTLIYDIEFTTGLFAVTASASNDVTFTYQ